MDSVDLNYLTIIAATVANMALGFAWYGPLFSQRWLAAMGREADSITPPPAWHWGIIVGGALITAGVLAVIIDWAGGDNVVDGLLVGLIAALGLIATESIKRYVYEEGPIALLAINNGYAVVGFAIMGAILGAWR